LKAKGHEVLPVGRKAVAGGYDWSAESLTRGVQAADAVINLAGENLFARRWTAAQKEKLIASRVTGTTELSRLVAARKPACFISASAIGFYGPNATDTLDESSPSGSDFLAGLCRQWEEATREASAAGVRTLVVRTGVVLDPNGGALAQMLPPFRLGVGGPLGSGSQWVSWIHLDDLVELFLFLLGAEGCSGAFNATAPNPVSMKELSRALGKALHRPAVMPVPGFALRLALGEVADILLTGQRVLPQRALAAGVGFRFPEVSGALEDLVGKKLVT
jgi:uncharacterized protein (TIGR01777 family)